MNLDRLLQQHPELQRGRHLVPAPQPAIASGFPLLDRHLPGNGWPHRAITELLVSGNGGYALALLLPALSRLSRKPPWIVLVAPPQIPYAPALQAHGLDLSRLLLIRSTREQERQWALEQALRCGSCSAVLAWPGRLDMTALRRLQLAAEAGDSIGFLLRSSSAAEQASPAALRLRVEPAVDGWRLDILKRQGGWPMADLMVTTDH